ncbi:cytochrome C oxidase subunit IV family protein [Fictibacillus sp. Mic-4]|uniref:cytochrome C oxidase subunit IV family protein n=1 Tax=Fictibacillus TaxID=1329200 RepID=UPI00040C9EEA|nr:cytochrome C oxidase subunit IV family protein [Fictibacillus gelatini]
MAEHHHTEVSKTELLQRKLEIKQERKQHTISFVMMILLTIIAFYAIWSDKVPNTFAVLFILVLAIVQVFFQLYIWMHLSHKGHEFPILGIATGILCAAVTVAGIAAMIWTT